MKLRLMKTNAMTLGTRVQRGSGASGVKRGFVGEGDCTEPGWKKEWNLEKRGHSQQGEWREEKDQGGNGVGRAGTDFTHGGWDMRLDSSGLGTQQAYSDSTERQSGTCGL